MNNILFSLLNAVNEEHKTVLAKSISPNNTSVRQLEEVLKQFFANNQQLLGVLFHNELSAFIPHVVVADTFHTYLILNKKGDLFELFLDKKSHYNKYGLQLMDHTLLTWGKSEREIAK